MNPKQVGALLLLVGIFLAVQLGMIFQERAKKVDLLVEQARSEEKELQTQLSGEKTLLADLQRQSSELLGFIKKWKPFFALVTEQQSAETQISFEVREQSMLTLSQRYEQVPHKINNKDITSLPTLVRASLLFDDNYTKLLNWIGRMEKIKPTMRVGRVSMSKGSRGNDLRVELVLEVPLRNVNPKES